MPTFEMSDALREALASVRTDIITYFTFELWHEDWDETVRIVHGWDEIEARIEQPEDADAVQLETTDMYPTGSAGELATFYPVPMEFTLPTTQPDEIPTFEFKFPDIGNLVARRVITSQGTPKKILMFMRVYLSNNLDIGPETIPVPRYNVSSLRISTQSQVVSGRCIFNDYMGRSVPFRSYTFAEYPSLRRQ